MGRAVRQISADGDQRRQPASIPRVRSSTACPSASTNHKRDTMPALPRSRQPPVGLACVVALADQNCAQIRDGSWSGRPWVISMRSVRGIAASTLLLPLACATGGPGDVALAFLADGGVDESGKLFPSDNGLLPLSAHAPARIVELAAASDHVCAILADGGVYCWGDSRRQRLRRGSQAGPVWPTARRVPLLSNRGLTKLALASPRCGLTASGDVLWKSVGSPEVPGHGEDQGAEYVVERFCPFALSCLRAIPSFSTRGISLRCTPSFARISSARSPCFSLLTRATTCASTFAMSSGERRGRRPAFFADLDEGLRRGDAAAPGAGLAGTLRPSARPFAGALTSSSRDAPRMASSTPLANVSAKTRNRDWRVDMRRGSNTIRGSRAALPGKDWLSAPRTLLPFHSPYGDLAPCSPFVLAESRAFLARGAARYRLVRAAAHPARLETFRPLRGASLLLSRFP